MISAGVISILIDSTKLRNSLNSMSWQVDNGLLESRIVECDVNLTGATRLHQCFAESFQTPGIIYIASVF